MPDHEGMPKRRPRSPDPAAPLTRPRPRLGHVAAPQVSTQLRDLLEQQLSETSSLPAAEELYALLVFAERASRRIGDARLRGEAAVQRVLLWQWLREQIDTHQLRAVDDARAADVEWVRLVRPLGVESVPGAHNKVRRMRADEAVGADGVPVRRTPEAVSAALAARAAEEAEARVRAQVALARAGSVLAAARSMGAHAHDLLTDDGEGEIDFWLGEIEAVLAEVDGPGAGTPTEAQVSSLSACLSQASQRIRALAKASAKAAAGTEGAAAALEAAASITG
ncbi:hypothetical protein [Streptacidiphilus neutrinimicus]|uniref:hypothetical protein n=1 Tax=Streptacidiphilus neutrinimicus TaxID=105420 RepID=UPI000694AB8B|nr:hypothetical protein [Streptacidiphilus neutrinimicus]